jgi:hypothetical protein
MEPRSSGHDESAPSAGGAGAPGPVDARFDDVVRGLVADRAWRRRIRLAHLRHWLGVVGRGTWNALADLGRWFTCVPPQRCAVASARPRLSPAARP